MVIPTPITHPETGHLSAIRRYGVLDALPEQALDNITALAAAICDSPFAHISLVDGQRRWIKSKVGFTSETEPDATFCRHALRGRDLFVVPDASLDPRFADHPMVTGEPGVRFYAGMPLLTPTGEVIGTLCVYDRRPRALTTTLEQSLRVLADQVMTHVELRRQILEQAESERLLTAVTDSARVGLMLVNNDRRYIYANEARASFYSSLSPAIIGHRVQDVLPDLYEDQIRPRLDRAFAGERVSYELYRRVRDEDQYYAVRYEPTSLEGGEPAVIVVITDLTPLRKAEAALHEAVRNAESTTDALSTEVCVLDSTGTIVSTNLAWRKFAEANGLPEGHAGMDDNYLHVCDVAAGPGAADAAASAKGIRAVLRCEETQFTMEYDCHSPWEKRWFVMRVTRFPGDGPVRAVIAHENITERKQAELVTLRLAAIVSSSDDAIVGKDLQGIITSWNKGAQKVFGYTAEEMVGQSITRLMPDDRKNEENQILAKIRVGESVEHFETVRQRKDGRLIEVSVTISPVKDAAGKILGVSKVARDITERKQAETLLRESNRRFQEMLENVDLIAITLDRVGKITFCNDFLLRLTGWTRDEIIGRDWFSTFLPESAASVETLYLENVEAGTITAHLQNPIKTRTGEQRLIQWNNTMLRDDDGKFTGAASIGEDVTDRVRAEAARRESELRLRQVVENIHEVFWMTDLEKKRMIYISPGYETIWGRTCESLHNSPDEWTQAIHPDDRERVQWAAATRQVAGSYDETYRIVQPDGGIRWVRDRAFPVRDESGVIYRIAGVAEDITERKQLEEQFLRAQRMESIGTLAGGIAHDLNNVLSPIVMSLDLLNLRFPDPASRELLAVVGSSAKRGADMVRQVLSFGRGVEGRRMEVQVKHLIQDIEKIVYDTFLKNIRISIVAPHGLWTVLGDPTQIHQVLLNLCVNARDAMPEGGLLTLKAENFLVDEHYAALDAEAQPGAYVCLQVEDTGTGIPPESIEKIFDPFFTTKEFGKGTGLGLSTSVAIVKSHGGFIRVHSEPGRGTTFKIYLPAQTKASAEIAAEVAAEMPRGKGELILVVDDEASVRQITQQTLEALGYRVIVASDGAEALAAYATQGAEIAAVLTDMTMPVMDGASTIRVLQKLNPKLPIIAASGLGDKDQGPETAAGVKHFLCKPYTAGSLLRALRQILDTD